METDIPDDASIDHSRFSGEELHQLEMETDIPDDASIDHSRFSGEELHQLETESRKDGYRPVVVLPSDSKWGQLSEEQRRARSQSAPRLSPAEHLRVNLEACEELRKLK